MKKLLGLLVVLAVIAGLFWYSDMILEAVGQPELAKQARAFRDDLLVKTTGKTGDEVGDKIAGKARSVGEMLETFKASMGFDPDELASRAVETFKENAGMVSEDFAAYYETLKAQGGELSANATEYALTFSEHYSDEIAPEIVGYWNEQIASGKLAKDKLEKAKNALTKIRAKMQPLLTDHLRVLDRLESKFERTTDEKEKAELKQDIEEVEADIQRTFQGVPTDERVLDSKAKASERLKIHLESSPEARAAADGPIEAAARTEVPAPPSDPAPAAAAPETAKAEATEAEAAAPEAAAPEAAAVEVAGPMKTEQKLRRGVKPWLNTPYKMGTNIRGKSTDCSGFVGGVMKDTFKLQLPRTSRLQYKFGDKVKKKSDLLPGDLVFFDMKKRKRIDHVGVYVGKNEDGVEQFAHASFSRGVRYDDMAGYYRKFYWGAARVLGE